MKDDNVVDFVKRHKEEHAQDSFDNMIESCMVDGAIDLEKFLSYEKTPVGYNGGLPCDVRKGPCSCGAWH